MRTTTTSSGGNNGATTGRDAGADTTTRRVKGTRRKTIEKAQRPKKRKTQKLPETWTASLAAFLVRNQIRMSLTLIIALATTHIFCPHLRPITRKFYEISYYNESTGKYGKGLDDLYLVFFWITVFTFLRSTILDYVLLPLARLGGINTKKGIVRFTEQAWLLLYYSAFWGVGMNLMSGSPYWLNMQELWTDYPVYEVSGLFKWYYLAQFAFWLQQIFVLNIEEWRKDHWQMFAHHIITCALISASYTHHLTRVGHVILCIMDVIDILLSAAKLLKYLGYSTLCDYAFGIFMVGWIVGRHGIYNMITWSVYRDSGRLITPACYSRASNSIVPDLEVSWPITRDTFLFKSDVVCFTDDVRRVFLILLVGLQIITLIWLYMIFRVAWRVVTGAGADDTRSEDELSDDDQDVQEEPESSGDSEELEQMEEIGEAIGEAEIRAVNGLKKKETVVDKHGRVTGSRAKRSD